MKTMITGDSHSGALKKGLDILIAQEIWPTAQEMKITRIDGANNLLVPYFVDRGDRAELIYQKYVKSLPVTAEEGHYDYYGLCAPLHASNLWRKQNYWPGFTPFADKADGDQGLIPVSTALLKQAVFQEQAYTIQLLELLQRVGVKLFVVEAPRPFRHHKILSKVSPETVMYIDTFYKNLIKEWLTSKDIAIIEVPNECYDEEGFMLDQFRGRSETDMLHGNEEFGVLMIHEVLKFLQSKS